MQTSQPLLVDRVHSDLDHRAAAVESFRTKRLAANYWIVAGVVLLGIGILLVSQHVTYNPAFHYSHYLDEVGSAAVGLCVGGCLQLSTGLVLKQMEADDITDVPGEARLALVMRKDAFRDSTSVSAIFGNHGLTWARVSSLSLELVSWASNLVSFALSAYGALSQPRDPDQAMDFLQHVMPALELSFSVSLLILFVFGLIKHASVAAVGALSTCDHCNIHLRWGASFSSASLLGIGHSDMTYAIEYLQVSDKRFIALLLILLAFIEVMLGVAALMTKVASLSFVSSVLMPDWSHTQVLALLVFANNVLKMGRSYEQVTCSEGQLLYGELVAAGADDGDMEVIQIQRLASLARDLMNTYGRLQGFAIYALMTKSEASKMFHFDVLHNSDRLEGS